MKRKLGPSKDRPKKLNRDGLPVDARDWTEADWRELHEAIERIKRNVARRHQPKGEQQS